MRFQSAQEVKSATGNTLLESLERFVRVCLREGEREREKDRRKVDTLEDTTRLLLGVSDASHRIVRQKRISDGGGDASVVRRR